MLRIKEEDYFCNWIAEGVALNFQNVQINILVMYSLLTSQNFTTQLMYTVQSPYLKPR
jgi:hypothetical protein